jgi:hypothetical protein
MRLACDLENGAIYQQEVHARDHSDRNLETLPTKAKQELFAHDLGGLLKRIFES